jgi:hypothetical protein
LELVDQRRLGFLIANKQQLFQDLETLLVVPVEVHLNVLRDFFEKFTDYLPRKLALQDELVLQLNEVANTGAVLFSECEGRK